MIEALELAWLFLCGVDLIFHSAHLFATASDAFRRIKTLIQNTPDLDRQVLKYSEAHGQEGLELRSGQRLRFVARSKSGGRGFPAPVVVLDEAFNLSKQAMAALVPTMAAQDNPFLLVTSSAPIEDECSDVLRQFMRRSRSGEVDRRCYIEYSAQRGEDFDKQLREANPGYGVRLNNDVIAEEQELLTPEMFQVERLGIVNLDEVARFEVVDGDIWAASEDPGHVPAGQLSYALDVDTNFRGEEWCSIAVSDGVHVELVTPPGVTQGTHWVVSAVVGKRDRFTELLIDPNGPAGKLIGPLEAEDIPVRKVTAQEFTQASMAFVDRVTEGQVRHLGQPRLTAAVAGVSCRDTGDGSYRFSRKLSNGDVAPLVSSALACWAAQSLSTGEADYFEI